MKRILKAFKEGENGYEGFQWSKAETDEVSKILLKIKLPTEIHRSVRGLEVLPYWKGSECGAFLNYIGVAVFKNFVPQHEYTMFLHLFCAITICSCAYFKRFLSLAQIHFENFIKIARKTFKVVSSNIHNLVHVVDEIIRFGPLYTLSSYPFENLLYLIKRLLRSGRLPLQQVINRISEETLCISHCNSNANIKYPLYTKLTQNERYLHIILRDGFNLKSNYCDKWFLSTDKEIFAFEYAKDGIIYGSKLENYGSAFDGPLDSTNINVFSTQNDNQFEEQKSFPLQKVLCKLVAIVVEMETTFVPLHHTYPEKCTL